MILLLLLACQEGGSPAAAPEPLDVSWITTVVRDPARFSLALDQNGGRDAWIAFHRNDWLNVRGATDGSVAERRAHAELAAFEGVLWVAGSEALLTLADGWKAHSPDTPMPKWLVASAQRVAELRKDAQAAERWRSAASSAGVGFDAASVKPFAIDLADGVTIDALRTLSGSPLDDPSLGSFWDPTRALALERAYVAGAGASGVGLPEDLFGTLPEAAMGGRPEVDDVEACRTFTQTMDARLDAWSVRLTDGATDDGRALLSDLRLVAVGRSRTLTSLAVDALRHNRGNCALFYAEQALDHAAAREISPVNSPTVFAVVAAANVRTGHVREALDALTTLRAIYPETIGVIETIGDLAVQQGLDRSGVSREN